MIKVKLGDIVDSVDTFQVIMQQSFKGSLAFKIARLARELNKEMETFNEQRKRIIDEYCVRDDNGEVKTFENGNIQIIPEKIEEFNVEITNILNTEVEVNADKLPMDKIDDFDITPQQMLILESFFEE